MTSSLGHDVAHLGHAELLTPEPEKSLWFFTEVLGLTQNGVQRRLGLPADLGRLRASQPQADRVGELGHAPHRAARRQRGGAEAPGRRDRGSKAWASAGRTATWASDRRTCSATLTVTSSSCTGRPSGTGRRRAQAVAEEPGPGLPGARGVRPPARPRELPRRRRPSRTASFIAAALGARVTEQIVLERRHHLGTVAALRAEVLRPRVHQRLDRVGGPPAPHRVRYRHQGGHPAGPRTSAWTAACSSRPGRTSTRSSRRSSSTSTSQAATGSSCATRARG